MSRLLETLEGWGCNVKDAMERMADDEAVFAECLRDVADSPYFEKLETASEPEDSSEVYYAEHTLQGVLLNVGLTPVYNKVVQIVDLFGQGSRKDLLREQAELKRMVADLLEPLNSL